MYVEILRTAADIALGVAVAVETADLGYRFTVRRFALGPLLPQLKKGVVISPDLYIWLCCTHQASKLTNTIDNSTSITSPVLLTDSSRWNQ